jgi:hypothetical protein
MRPRNLLALLMFLGLLATTVGCGPSKPVTVTPGGPQTPQPTTEAASDTVEVK